MSEFNSVGYYRSREERLRGLAEAAKDVAISTNYLEMASRYAALIEQSSTQPLPRSKTSAFAIDQLPKRTTRVNAQAAIRLENATSLAQAIVIAAGTPTLLLNHDGKVIVANPSFCDLFGLSAGEFVDRSLLDLDLAGRAFPSLDTLLDIASRFATAVALELDFDEGNGVRRRFTVDVRMLDHHEAGDAHLLVTLTDITQVRLLERRLAELAHDRDIERRELQHRTANCLQIVASVLMHNARAASSEAAKCDLRSAYNRIMSVAAAQQQLAIGDAGEIALLPYLRELCRHLTASLVRDRGQVAITVSADATVTSADVSVSLGLIVTEVVINALKHAFPDDETAGRVTIDFRSENAGWRLTVSDTGVGILPVSPRGGSGLGNNIVDALARKLGAKVIVSSDAGGTTVAIAAPAALSNDN